MGVKSFLVQVADAQKVLVESLEVSSSGYWEGEIRQTEKMTRINSSLNKWSSKALLFLGDTRGVDFKESVNDANDALSVSADLEVTNDVTHAVLGQEGMNALFSVVFQAFATNDLKVVISESENNILAKCTASNPNDALVTQLVKTDDPSGDKNIGQLIAAFILVSHLGGTLKLSFDASKLAGIEILLPQAAHDKKGEDIQGGTWIEDLFVLYS